MYNTEKIIRLVESIDVKIEITTDLTEVNFLELTYNLEKNT